jgi:endo-1,4-beta-xylanase
MSLTALAADSQDVNIVNNGDMENGTNWWYNNGSSKLTSVSDEKSSGSYSIKVTERTASWQGIAQNLNNSQAEIPVAGTKYNAAAWVMYNGDTAPETVTFKLSIRRNDGTDTKYDTIKQLDVLKGVWTKLESKYTLPADTDVSKEVHLYVETNESTETFVDYYLDDVSFSLVTSPETSNDKVVALTFDDGPNSTLTPLVLDKLEKYKVPATFMMVGSNINDSTKDVIKRVVDLGCEIGNHSWSYSSMDKMTAEEIQKSIGDTTAKIQEYSGKTPLFFRPANLATSTTMFDAII